MDPFVTIELNSPATPQKSESVPRDFSRFSHGSATGAPLPAALRDRFAAMRQLAQDGYAPRFDYHTPFYSIDQRERFSQLFYKQAVLMADVEDDYRPTAPFNAYYPFYHMMNAEQLRTYFSWRTQLRQGVVTHIGISYAYLYVYELLNQIGTAHPADGLLALVSFWKAYRAFSTGLDKYVIPWLKDYHVYYAMPEAFGDFVREHKLQAQLEEKYTDISLFDLYCDIANYDLKRSPFFTPQTQPLIQEAALHVLQRLDAVLEATERPLDGILFNPLLPGRAWKPFAQALFAPKPTPDKKVILSPAEIYTCRKNQWICRTAKQCNRKLMGYILKQTESLLRQAEGFKRGLSAKLGDMDDATLIALQVGGVKLDVFIAEAIKEFLALRNRVEVTVRPASLAKIRMEALEIQEKLTVEDALDKPATAALLPAEAAKRTTAQPTAQADPWVLFAQALTDIERGALSVLVSHGDINAYAAEHRLMAEVLTDGINQKAADTVGDTLIDDEIYPEYMDTLKKVIKGGIND